MNFGHRGEISPLEANVIELWRPKGRFIDFGARTLINYKDFSLLIKNMPLENAERYGMLKDLLGTLCNAIEARVKFLLYENSLFKKEQIVSTVLNLMEEIDKAFSKVQESNVDVINQMIDELDEAILELGLTSQQDDRIRKIATDCRENSGRVFDQGVELYGKFETVRQQLDHVLGRG